MTNKEAIEILAYIKEEFGPVYQEAFDLAIKALEDRPIGHWGVKVNNLNKDRTIHCSICDYNFPSWQDKPNFCPNCGARMGAKNE